MTDEALTEDLAEEIGEDVEVEARQKSGGLSGKKLVLFIVLPILLLVITGAGLYFSGVLDSLLGIQSEGELSIEDEVAGPAVFFDLPEMLVNLNSGSRKASYLKISVSLEIDNQDDVADLEKHLPRIVDNFQVYLRELRVEDLGGSAGLQRLREELLLRVNAAVRPVIVRDVLFKEMLVQ